MLLTASVHHKFHQAMGGTHKIVTREDFEQWAREKYGITSFPWQNNHEPTKVKPSVEWEKTPEQKLQHLVKKITIDF